MRLSVELQEQELPHPPRPLQDLEREWLGEGVRPLQWLGTHPEPKRPRPVLPALEKYPPYDGKFAEQFLAQLPPYLRRFPDAPLLVLPTWRNELIGGCERRRRRPYIGGVSCRCGSSRCAYCHGRCLRGHRSRHCHTSRRYIVPNSCTRRH